MLQWMGGSRRKVTTSRKSTHKRQKQYFEQKKRQQQTAGLDSNGDGINSCGQYPENPNSLDILSFLNLAMADQECKPGCTNGEDPEPYTSHANCQLSKCLTTSRLEKCIPKDSTDLKEAETKTSGHEADNASPKKVFASHPDVTFSHNYYSQNGTKLDCCKTETQHQLSVLDLLGDDGPDGNSQGSPVNEAHVAFSVEGLGKMGMETPVHLPQQPGRVFFKACCSPPKSARQHHSSKNLKFIMEDLELELNAMIQDINMPLSGDPLEIPFNSRCIRNHSGNSKSSKFFVKSFMPLDACDCQMDNLFNEEECLHSNIKENENPWNATSGCLDENFPDERVYNVAWKNQPYDMDSNYVNFLRDGTHSISDFDFGDSYLLKRRNVAKAPRELNILELDSPAPYFNHLASEDSHDFITSDAARYQEVDGSWDFSSPTCSYFATEDAKDYMSLLSEESCSSSAVRAEKAKYTSTNSMKLGESVRKHGTKFHRSQGKNYGKDNLCTEETGYKDLDELHLGKNQRGSEKNTRVLYSSRGKPLQSKENSRARKDLESERSWLSKEGHIEVHTDSGHGSFCRTAERNLASLECKFLSGGLFGEIPVSKLHSNTYQSAKRAKLGTCVKCAPIWQASKMQGEPLYSSDPTHFQGGVEFPTLQENVIKDGEDKSEFWPTDCGNFPNEPQKEVSVGNNDLPLEIGKIVDAAPCSKDNCSDCIEAKDEIPVLIQRPKTRYSPELAEETSSATKEVLVKLGSHVNVKCHFDAHVSLPSRIGSKGKEDLEPEKNTIESKKHNNQVDPTYQVMLESYVHQLLCVQKVLNEAFEKDLPKKV